MKLPEPAPDWYQLFKEHHLWLLENINNQELLDQSYHANKEYLHWEKIRHLTLPADVTPEIFWLFLKMKRQGQLKKLSLKDKSGNPFQYWIPDELLKDLHYIDTHSANHAIFGGSASTTTEKIENTRYLISSLMEEAIASSQLEGAATTREVAKIMLQTGAKPASVSDRMILNNYHTMQDLQNLAKKPLSFDSIKSIQARITANTLDKPDASGRFRNSADDAVHVVDDSDNSVLFSPPPFNEIEGRLQVLCDYANQEHKNEFCHPVIKAIIIHFWLSYIHPFVDGNGRTARALFYWYLIKNGYWKFEYLSISRILKKAPAQYARAFLYSEADENDMTYFIAYHLRAIREAIDEFDAYLQRKIEQHKKMIQYIHDKSKMNFRQAELIDKALFDPAVSFTIKTVRNTYAVVPQTARMDLMGLVTMGLFMKRKIGREFYFSPVADIKERLDQLKEKNT